MIVIDPSRGGSDIGVSSNGIVEKDFNLLISEYIYDRLKNLGADIKIIRTTDETISERDRASRILNAYGNNSKVVALSNKLGSDNPEIVYALRNKDTLAKSLSSNLEDAGLNIEKYYQRRSEKDTSKDYYDIQKDTGVIETIVVDYGNISNSSNAEILKNNYKKYAEAVVKTIANYKGIPYYIDGMSSNTYTVKKGDSLYSIANKFNTTVNEIKVENNLKNNNLSIGQILVIPIKNINTDTETYIVQSGDSLYSIANKFNTTVDNIKRLNNITSNLLQIGQILKINEDMNVEINENEYIVKKGDSLYSIAQKYNTTADEIKKINNLTSNNLSINQKLLIPLVQNNQNTYVVQKGDSLYSIANKFNTTVNELKAVNNLVSNTLSINQVLVIPNNISNDNYNTYIVKKGDSLYKIALEYNTTVDKIKNINNLTSNLLNIGQQLKIPN